MALLSIQHALQSRSGLAEDRFVNTFHCEGTGTPTEGQLTAMKDALVAFYMDGGTTRVGNYMADVARASGRTIKIYNLADAKPRAPIYEFIDPVVPWVSTDTGSLPSEVACCISYKAAALSGSNAARRRGRIYIGPLRTSCLDKEVGTDAIRPLDDFRNALLTSFGNLLEDFAAAGHPMSVYSRMDDPGETGDIAASRFIQTYWVDDAFDTQRRRGVAPTLRVTASVPA